MKSVSMLLGVVFTAAVVVQASDWPRWGGPLGNGHAPEDAPIPQTLPTNAQVVWRIPVGMGLCSPAVAGGRVYYQDNQRDQETVQAVDAATGKPLWTVPLDAVFKDTQSSPGPRGTPLVDGERVYAQSCRGEFRCLEADSGKTLWRIHFVKDFGAYFLGEQGAASGASRHGYTGSPWIAGERLYVGVGGTNGASVVCFEKRTGKAIWRSQNDIPGHAGPVLAEIGGKKQAISFSADGVFGLDDEDGALLWRFPVQTRLGRHAITPVVVDDTVVVSSYLAGLIGVRVTRGADGWKAERAWLEKSLAINFASPVAVGPYLYGLGPGRKLLCVEIRTGKKSWSQAEPFTTDIEAEHAGMVAFPDRLLVLGHNGRLLLVAADPAQFRALGSVQVCGPTWCNPAYADGKLFLRDDKELLCVKITP